MKKIRWIFIGLIMYTKSHSISSEECFASHTCSYTKIKANRFSITNFAE